MTQSLRYRLLLGASEILTGELFQASTFRNAAALPNVKLITWREIGKLIGKT
jgi:hypothetical protein